MGGNAKVMKFFFRDIGMALRIVEKIKALDDQPVKIMHVCGTHEQIITKHGLRTLLPENIEVVAGPGCPVCITPVKEIDEAVYLADKNIVATYGDMLRVPGTSISLAGKRSAGGDIRMIYSPAEAVEIAKKTPDREVIFFAIGFETTAPMTAQILLNSPPENFSILCSHRLIPPALDFLLKEGIGIDGLIDPGHVSTIIGAHPYEELCNKYNMPQVIAGFEPLDVLMAIYMLMKQIRNHEARVENEYTRFVTYEGNTIAQEMLSKAFKADRREWRGLGVIPQASLALRKEFEDFDARKKFDIPLQSDETCDQDCFFCANVIKGAGRPKDCPNFGENCTPDKPIGACMVSTEGTCSIAYRYGTIVNQQ
jgi:hydrogenase expression/formation protein HypD